MFHQGNITIIVTFKCNQLMLIAHYFSRIAHIKKRLMKRGRMTSFSCLNDKVAQSLLDATVFDTLISSYMS